MEQRSARPTFEINGLTSGYQGDGQQNHRARLGAGQNHLPPRAEPETRPFRKMVCDYLRKICPPTVRLEIEAGHGAEAYLVSPAGPLAQAALRALRQAFHREPILMREGGSIPDCERIQENPRRGFPAAGPGVAGRQRPFAERKVQPGLF